MPHALRAGRPQGHGNGSVLGWAQHGLHYDGWVCGSIISHVLPQDRRSYARGSSVQQLCVHALWMHCLGPGTRFHLRNRGTSQRSATNPLGEERHESVRTGNILLCRTLVFLWIAQALRVHWILEQPKGSVMELHPRFQEMLGRLSLWKHTISMKAFGAPSMKPTWLYSSPLIEENAFPETYVCVRPYKHPATRRLQAGNLLTRLMTWHRPALHLCQKHEMSRWQ